MVLPKKPEYSKILLNKNFSGSNIGIRLYNETRIIVRNLLIALIDCEISTESKKRKLISVPGFSNYESYEIIKGKFKSFILKEDVIGFFGYFFLLNF